MLTKENIRFIDNYLENSNITYNDVRLEMVDHIASDIESQMNDGGMKSFHDAFKAYMIENKESILDNHETFKKATDKKIIKMLFKQFLSFKGLLLVAIIGLTLFMGLENLEIEIYNRTASIVYFCLYVGALSVVKIICKKNRTRYSALERLMGMLVIFFLCIFSLFDFKYEASFSREYVYVYLMIKSIALMLPILFLMAAIQFKRDYELKYGKIL